MLTVGIPCQKFTDANELKTLSRTVLSVDAQRMLGVLDGAMKKILVILALRNTKCSIFENEKLNQDLKKIISDYLKISARYSNGNKPERKSSLSTPSEGNPNEPHEEVVENNNKDTKSQSSKMENAENSDPSVNLTVQEVNEVKENITLTVRQLLRVMKSTPYFDQIPDTCLTVKPRSSSTLPDLKLPLSVSNFQEACSQAYLSENLSRPQSHLLRYFLELRGTVFSNMLTTPEDRKRQKKYVKEISNRLNEHQIKVDGLNKELDAIVAKNKAQVQSTAQKVLALQQEIQNLGNYLLDRGQRIKKDENEKLQMIEEKYKIHMETMPMVLDEYADLEKKVNELREAYNKQVEENRKGEKKERANLFKIETELEAKISAYDQEMTALKTLEEEYMRIMEERRLEEERKQREEEQRRALEQSVTTIQAYWRSYKTRKMARGKRGGKGKK
ncbi:unnamed protein product [Echinostoma caproni]|uniref:Dynein regulatory complex protein 10 n=1 Tax=Echinostoma caproni TaxID=27848 RepID=A0A183AV97_9TREM|nr:unnamed protein product [Echinostoma caproni]